MKKEMSNKKDSHTWNFFRAGSVEQVLLESNEDLIHLKELDQKLWMVLSMPCTHVNFEEKTLRLLDTDNDGFIRPPEILEAVDFICSALKNPSIIFEEGSSISLDNIKDKKLYKSASFLLKALGKSQVKTISYEDSHKRSEAFTNLIFNGDGNLELTAIENKNLQDIVIDILSLINKLSKEDSELIDSFINREMIEGFSNALKDHLDWKNNFISLAEENKLQVKDSKEIIAILKTHLDVKEKIDDYFLRCEFARFDKRTETILQRNENELEEVTKLLLNQHKEVLEGFPIAQINSKAELKLNEINPLWKTKIDLFKEHIYKAFFSHNAETSILKENDWKIISKNFSSLINLYEEKASSPFVEFSDNRLEEIYSQIDEIFNLIAKDEAHAEERCLVDLVAKLMRYRRDLGKILKNFINFEDFYNSKLATFQAGSLYIDGRVCHLCIEIADEEKHAPLAALSGAFLLYCDIRRADEKPKKMLAMVSAGDNETLLVGRNGVFYDRKGRDWQAQVRRIISAPISVGQAFWQPYKKLYRIIEDQIIKSSQKGEADMTAKLTQGDGILQTLSNGQASTDPKARKKLDLGAIALIGTAIGGISALVSAFFQSLFSLGFWLPLGLLSIILLISGPSMLLASMKLKKRNLGPILDANGWAINIMARINIPFGTSLTELSSPPPGSLIRTKDPFKIKKATPKIIAAFLLLISIASFVYFFPEIFSFVKNFFLKK